MGSEQQALQALGTGSVRAAMHVDVAPHPAQLQASQRRPQVFAAAAGLLQLPLLLVIDLG